MQISTLTYNAQSIKSSAQLNVKPVQITNSVAITSTMQPDEVQKTSLHQKGTDTLHIDATSSINTSDYLSLRDKINPKKEGFLYENE